MDVNEQSAAEQRIAVIGMAGRFPGAPDLDAFWRMLAEGREGLTRFDPDGLDGAGKNGFVPVSGPLEQAAGFDAEFFGFTPAEAEVTDPQHRLFLECAWQALEHAGYAGRNGKSRVGVFAGASHTSYRNDRINAHPRAAELWHPVQVSMGNDIDAIPLRVSYKLGLTGPSMVVQTACSSALVAVHLACQSLLLGESDLGLAGGASVRLLEPAGYHYQEGGILSPDGHCRSFDAAGQGTVPGDGVGVVVLKRLDDAQRDGDCVHAVILGSAVNNDGLAKAGFTAPSAAGQAAVIADALAFAGVEPATIDYVEGHGTATPLGDPIEVQALREAFPPRPTPRVLGSVKSNIGHLDAAAGIAGLIKTVLALQNRFVPPTLHFEQPNPQAGLADSGFTVSAAGAPWPGGNHPPRAGVSSFGFGGTNAHIVLEAAPPAPQDRTDTASGLHVLPLSARTESALAATATALAGHLAQHPELSVADVAFTLQGGREHMPVRRAVVVDPDATAAAAALQEPGRTARIADPHPFVVFLLPGQGSQYAGMGADLYRNQPVFRAALDECANLFTPHLGTDLREVMFATGDAAAERLTLTRNTQPAVFAMEIALARLVESWGVRPAAMAGHSLGELTAARLAGVLTLEDAVTVVAARAKLLQEAPRGTMIAVPLGAAEVRELLVGVLSDDAADCASIAVLNAPTSTIVAGTEAGVARVRERLTERDVRWRALDTSHAFHTALVDDVVPAFAKVMRSVRLAAPQIPFLSNETGTWITDEQATDPDYWAAQVRRPVNFTACLRTLLSAGAETPGKPVLLEAGPGAALTGFARLHRGAEPVAATSMLRRRPATAGASGAEERSVLQAVAALWEHGAAVDWAALNPRPRHRLPLPGYPFERRPYLVAGPEVAVQPTPAPDVVVETDDLVATITGIWREVLGIDVVNPHEDYYEIGGNSLFAIQIMGRLRTIEPDLPMSTIFTAPTIAGLADVIRGYRGAGDAAGAGDLDDPALASLLDEIEGLAPDEIEALLREDGDK